jgi:hypothetical protein
VPAMTTPRPIRKPRAIKDVNAANKRAALVPCGAENLRSRSRPTSHATSHTVTADTIKRSITAKPARYAGCAAIRVLAILRNNEITTLHVIATVCAVERAGRPFKAWKFLCCADGVACQCKNQEE